MYIFYMHVRKFFFLTTSKRQAGKRFKPPEAGKSIILLPKQRQNKLTSNDVQRYAQNPKRKTLCDSSFGDLDTTRTKSRKFRRFCFADNPYYVN